MRLLFDVETDGLEATKVHTLVIKDVDTGKVWSCVGNLYPETSLLAGYDDLETGLKLLEQADVIIGHNIIKYDIPTLRRLFPTFNPRALVRDTLTLSRLIWTNMADDDFRRRDAGNPMPSTMIGDHNLKSWGYRLGVLKGAYNDTADWSKWTPEMQRYCEQDVEVTYALWKLIEKQNYAEEAIQLEHDFQEVIYLQELHGFRFNEQDAGKLTASLLARRDYLTTELRSVVPPRVTEMKTPEYWTATDPFGGVVHKMPTKGQLTKDLKSMDVPLHNVTIAPGPFKQKIELFNPGSRDQASAYLISKGWVPTKFTETGKPQVDETTLDGLTDPAAKLLLECYVVNKLLGQMSEGDNAWLKLSRKGRIHGAIITNGAVTGRCAHFKPNVGQVPAVMSDKEKKILLAFAGRWGWECRSLFMADEDQVLMGADASGLELRCLAHYMARYDAGAYGKILLEGDIHTVNQQAAGIDTRANAKTFVYSYLYGAGNHKLGVNCGGVTDAEIPQYRNYKTMWAGELKSLARKRDRYGVKFSEKDVALSVKGARIRQQFETKTPALARLKEALDEACKKGFLIGLDGRKLHVRSRHSALNTLLQAAGAIVVKKATIILHKKLIAEGFIFGRDFANVAHVHDELQLSVNPTLAERVGSLAVQSISEAGEHFKFRCRLDGEFKIGKTWAETH